MTSRAQTFLHLDAHLHEDPAIEDMDGCGLIVWVLGVLVLTKAGGFMGGIVPKSALTPKRIARKIHGCDDCGLRFSTEMAAHGLVQCAENGLLEDRGEDWFIPAWGQWQTDPAMSGAERMRRLRAKRKAEGDARDESDERASQYNKSDESDARDESDGHCTALHCTAKHGKGKKKRRGSARKRATLPPPQSYEDCLYGKHPEATAALRLGNLHAVLQRHPWTAECMPDREGWVRRQMDKGPEWVRRDSRLRDIVVAALEHLLDDPSKAAGKTPASYLTNWANRERKYGPPGSPKRAGRR